MAARHKIILRTFEKKDWTVKIGIFLGSLDLNVYKQSPGGVL